MFSHPSVNAGGKELPQMKGNGCVHRDEQYALEE